MLEQDDLAGPVPLTRHEQLSTSTASAVTLVSAPQATLEVTTLADTIDATDGLLSLREAITAANASAAPDTITFADSIRGGTIVLAEDLPTITRDLAIDGDPLDGGAGGISIDGGTSYGPAGVIGAYRVFNVDGATAHFEDMTFGHAIEVGLYSTGANVSLERNLVVANGYFHEGAALRIAGGQATVVDSTIQGSGGLEANIAVAFRDGAEVEIRNSTIADHFGEYQGGIFGNGALRIIDSTLARNGADIGGTGISVTGSLLIEGSTILDNGSHVAGGSGISVDGELLIVNSTIAGTQLSDYAGYGAIALAPGSSGSIVNSTVTGTFYRDAGNYSPADDTPTVGLLIGDGANVIVANSIIDDSINGTIVSNGANTFRDALVDGAVAGDRLGVAAENLFAATEEIGTSGVYRGVPADNGGPTETVALLDSATNPALNAADPADVPATDQRGYLRDATPDIGAFELGGTPPTPPNTLPPLAEKVPLPDSEIHGAPLFLVGPSGDAEIAFVDEVAAFQSSLGVYLVGPDGTIGATSWVFERIEHADASADASAAARPGGGPLAPGDAVQLSDLFDPADLAPGAGFGLFLVANGWALNDAAIFEGGTLEFRSNGGSAAVTDTLPELVHVAAGGGETLVLGNILHTIDAGSANPLSNTLNPGGTGQVTSGLHDGAFTVAFEDKPLGGGSDRDFNDALFAVEPLVTAEDVVAV